MRRLLCLVSLLLLALAVPARAQAAPPIGHVWLIQLENHSYDQTFNDAVHPYLWTQLRTMGQVLPNYYGTGHASLDNYIAQISGQAPNVMTSADCQIYTNVTPGIMGVDGQVAGQGCVYPANTPTLVDQLEAKGLDWRGYMEDMGNDPAREAGRCGAPPMDKGDPTQAAESGDQYAARHNPFVYFHSILDPPGRCAKHVGPLTPLQTDVANVATTPAFSWITPNLCNDAHDPTPCAGVNSKGTKEGDLIAADGFLAKWVPVITASPAFRKDGLLIITLDESSLTDSTACCGEPAGLNTLAPGITGPGGGRIGTLMISPYIQPGSVNPTFYNHYSTLRSLENVFGISQHLGYAALPAQPQWGADVFNRPGGGPLPGVPALPAGDAGSMGGKVVKLKLRLSGATPKRLASVRHGFHVRVVLTGSDRRLTPVQVRLLRRGRIVASSGTSRTVAGGRGSLRLKPRKVRFARGSYVLDVRAIHEGKVVARVRRTLRLR